MRITDQEQTFAQQIERLFNGDENARKHVSEFLQALHQLVFTDELGVWNAILATRTHVEEPIHFHLVGLYSLIAASLAQYDECSLIQEYFRRLYAGDYESMLNIVRDWKDLVPEARWETDEMTYEQWSKKPGVSA